MIEFRVGNIVKDRSDALVNTVNSVGVMGKGVALAFKKAFPENFVAYKHATEDGKIRPGGVFAFENPPRYRTRWILNLATKDHWRGRSRVEWIERGLTELREHLVAYGIRSVAVPPLGCGHGGLDWLIVRPLIVDALSALPNLAVVIYEPSKAYRNHAGRQPVESPTIAKALVSEVVRRYETGGLECSLLEAHKLAYFVSRSALDVLGYDPLRLRYQPHRYGPYSDQLRHPLADMEGQFIDSDALVADLRPSDAIFTLPEASNGARALLQNSDGRYRNVLDRVFRTIEGFESPQGLEVLASLDWLLREQGVEPTREALLCAVGTWPGPPGTAERKSRLITEDLLDRGLARLAA